MKLNPSHAVTQQLDGQWHKLLAIMMHKLGYKRVPITVSDIEAVAAMTDPLTVIAHDHNGCIDVLCMSESEAREYAASKGEPL